MTCGGPPSGGPLQKIEVEIIPETNSIGYKKVILWFLDFLDFFKGLILRPKESVRIGSNSGSYNKIYVNTHFFPNLENDIPCGFSPSSKLSKKILQNVPVPQKIAPPFFLKARFFQTIFGRNGTFWRIFFWTVSKNEKIRLAWHLPNFEKMCIYINFIITFGFTSGL